MMEKSTIRNHILAILLILVLIFTGILQQPMSAYAATGQDVVRIAQSLHGVPYKWAGKTPAGFDCSGFTYYVYQQVGINTPAGTDALRSAGTAVDCTALRQSNNTSKLQLGDLIMFDINGTGKPGHVGIYVGNGQMCHASSSRGVITVPLTGISSNTTHKKWYEVASTVRRFLPGGTSNPTTTTPSKPTIPAKPTINVTGNSVKVSWNGNSSVQQYDVYLLKAPWGWGDIKYSGSVKGVNGTNQYTFKGVRKGAYCAFVIPRPNPNSAQSEWASFSVTACSHSYILESEAAHPHKEYRKCTKCGYTEYTGVNFAGMSTTCNDCRKTEIASVAVSGNTVTVWWKKIKIAQSYDVYLVQAPWNWSDIKYAKSVSANDNAYTFKNVKAGEYQAFIIARPNSNAVQSKWAAVVVKEDLSKPVTPPQSKPDNPANPTPPPDDEPANESEPSEECDHHYILAQEKQHPHRTYYQCTECSDQYIESSSNYMESCTICNPINDVTRIEIPKLKLTATYNAMTASWTSGDGADGYQLQWSTKKSGGYKTLVQGKMSSYTRNNLGYNKKYYFRARAYQVVNGKKVYGTWSAVKMGKTQMKAPKVTVTKAKTGVKVTWTKVAGAQTYAIYRDTGKSLRKIKTVSAGKKFSYTDTKAKNYYSYQVVAQRTTGGKTYKVYSEQVFKNS